VLVLLAAVLVRSERGRVEAVGRRAATEERLRIARDLHDLVGHGLSAIAVQSSTARMALQSGDEMSAGTALTAVESTSRIALREMRQMLGVLTDVDGADGSPDEPGRPDGVPRPAPGLDDLGPMLDNVRAAGVAVALEQAGDWGSASPGVQLVIYRIVQEGLTNAVKHAPGSLVAVRLDASDGSGRVSVETVGSTAVAGRPSSTPRRGLGLDGLRTRVTAVAGELTYGPTDQGWILEARVPLHEEKDR
jgi:signal transduction histidine kinase